MRLHAGVPAERADHRHADIGIHVAHRIAHEPAEAALAQQLVGARRQGVGADRGEVLIRERIANQRVVIGVRAPRERPERRRDAADLDVEVARRPRTDPQIQRIGADAVEILAPDLAEQREVRARLERRRQIEPEQPQRRVLVVGVVEEAGIVRSVGRRRIAAERHAAAGQRDRLRRQRLGPGSGRQADHHHPRKPCGRAPDCHLYARIIVRARRSF